MPTYEYHCDSCGKDYDIQQRMSDKPLTTCACGAEGQIHRQMSAGSGIIFKGSGFYETDYKTKSEASTSKPAETKTETKSETKTETKSEPKAESKPSGGSGNA